MSQEGVAGLALIKKGSRFKVQGSVNHDYLQHSPRDIWVPRFNLGARRRTRRGKTYCAWATSGSERWALMTRRARGAASSPPWPPCSTKTATATWGSSAGA
jgi:hypothetical protein